MRLKSSPFPGESFVTPSASSAFVSSAVGEALCFSFAYPPQTTTITTPCNGVKVVKAEERTCMNAWMLRDSNYLFVFQRLLEPVPFFCH